MANGSRPFNDLVAVVKSLDDRIAGIEHRLIFLDLILKSITKKNGLAFSKDEMTEIEKRADELFHKTHPELKIKR